MRIGVEGAFRRQRLVKGNASHRRLEFWLVPEEAADNQTVIYRAIPEA